MEGKFRIHLDGVKATDQARQAGDTGGQKEAQKDRKDSQQEGAPLKFCLEALR